jgi:hypothetical protein
MADATSKRISIIRPLPRLPMLRAPLAAKHLDAALLTVVRRRKLEQSVLPGVPFH